MNIFQVAYKNLLRKKTRTILTILGIAISTWVLVTLLGFNKGYEKSLNQDIEGMGFQIILTAKGCPYEAATLMLKGGSGLRYISEDLATSVNSKTEISSSTSMLMHAEFDPNVGENGGTSVYLGVSPKTFPSMKPYFEFQQGEWFSDENALEAVLGYEVAELEQREVGDLILISNKDIEIKVVGILKRTGTQDDGMTFLPLRTTQTIFEKKGLITMLGMRLKKEVDVAVFEEELYKLPDVQVISMAQVKNTIMTLVASARVVVMSIAFIALLIAVFGVLNTILMSVFERYQEIGILKSMGALPKDIFKMIWIETILLCSMGGAVGIIFSLIFARVSEFAIRYFLPFAPHGNLIDIDLKIITFSFIGIIVVGILSGIYPSSKASKIRPLDAIRG